RPVDLDEGRDLDGSGPRSLANDTDPRSVDLLVDHVRLERRPFHRDDVVSDGAVRNADRAAPREDPGLVLRVALVVLLPIPVGDPRVRLHDDPGHRAVPPGEPRSFGADLPVRAEGLGRLAHVPDVTLLV